MIFRTKAELRELRDRMNNGEKSADIYKDLNERLRRTCGIKVRTFNNHRELKIIIQNLEK